MYEAMSALCQKQTFIVATDYPVGIDLNPPTRTQSKSAPLDIRPPLAIKGRDCKCPGAI